MNTLTIKRAVVVGVKGGLPLNEAFRKVKDGAIIQVNLAAGKHGEAYEGMVRVVGYETKRGRPAKVDLNPDFPTGSAMLRLECLDKSGRTINLNWRRDYDAITDFMVRVIFDAPKVAKPESDGPKVTLSRTANAEIEPTPDMVAAATALDAAVTVVPTA